MFFLTVAAPPPGEDALLDTYISHIALGSQDALAALYQRTHAAAYGFALSILKNAHDAEDVLQDVYLQVWHASAAVPRRCPMRSGRLCQRRPPPLLRRTG